MDLKKTTKFIPSLLWMCVIFYFSSRSTSGFGPDNPTDRFLLLKSFHLTEYAFLAILLSFAFLKKKSVIIIAYLYAISDEIHQSFTPGRSPRFQDTLIDLGGILIGIFIYQKIFSSKNRKNNLYWSCVKKKLDSLFYSAGKKQPPSHASKA